MTVAVIDLLRADRVNDLMTVLTQPQSQSQSQPPADVLMDVESDSIQSRATASGQHNGTAEASLASRFTALGKVSLSLCLALVSNEFTAVAFEAAGGVHTLSLLARQVPPLPPVLQSMVAQALALTLQHSSLTGMLIEPPSTG